MRLRVAGVATQNQIPLGPNQGEEEERREEDIIFPTSSLPLASYRKDRYKKWAHFESFSYLLYANVLCWYDT